MKHKILQNLSENELLDIIPSEYWILNCFFIILNDGEHKYLPLTYPIYKIDSSSGSIQGGLWTPPYIARRIEGTVKRLNTPRSIKKVILKYLKEHEVEINREIEYLFYYFGVQYYELIKFNEFTEYKTSYSEPTKVKCYHIINYMVTNVDKAGVVNLVDPECMRNLHFMNLDIDLKMLPKRKDENIPSYNGKIFASNLFKILNENLNTLIEENKSNRVDKNFLEYECEGILFSYDINSSGILRDEIESKYISLVQSGYDISEDFIAKILVVFTQILSIKNVHQYRLEGDGFVAAIPRSDFDMFGIDEKQIEPDIILDIARLCDQKINSLLINGDFHLTSKVALYMGKYKYGKIGGMEARSSTFSGKDMFVLARLREGISQWNQNNGKNNSCYGIISSNSNFKCDKRELQESIGMEIKESELDIKIYRRE